MELTGPIRSHPDYSDGYFDCLRREPFRENASEAYRAGWLAMEETRRIFTEAGMTESSATFSISGTVA